MAMEVGVVVVCCVVTSIDNTRRRIVSAASLSTLAHSPAQLVLLPAKVEREIVQPTPTTNTYHRQQIREAHISSIQTEQRENMSKARIAVVVISIVLLACLRVDQAVFSFLARNDIKETPVLHTLEKGALSRVQLSVNDDEVTADTAENDNVTVSESETIDREEETLAVEAKPKYAKLYTPLYIDAREDAIHNQICVHYNLALERSEQFKRESAGSSFGYNKPDSDFFIKKHPLLDPVYSQYTPRDDWSDNALADFNVVGLPKAGTSQLHSILQSHLRVEALGNAKEWCMFTKYKEPFRFSGSKSRVEAMGRSDKRAAQSAIVSFYKYAMDYRVRKGDLNKLTVNGCIWEHDFTLSHFYLAHLRKRTPKYFVLLRDPADWLWASLNFWVIDNFDATNDKLGAWTKDDLHYRTPEVFHEIIASGNKTKASKRLSLHRRDVMISTLLQVVFFAGRENVFIAKSEEMKPSRIAEPNGFLDQLASFANLNRTGFATKTYNSLSNCNDAKASTKCEEKKEATYKIAGSRPMLPETRVLVYLQFWEECKILAREFGIVYDDCVNIMESEDVEHCK